MAMEFGEAAGKCTGFQKEVSAGVPYSDMRDVCTG